MKKKPDIPFILLAMTLASFPFDQWNPFLPFLGPTEQFISLPQALTILTMLVWLFYIFFLGRTQYIAQTMKSPVTYCVLFYLIASLLSVAVSPDPVLSLGAVAKRVALFITFLLVINIVRGRKGFQIMVTVLAVSSLAYVLVGLSELITGEMFLDQMALGRTQLVGSQLGKVRIQSLETDPDLLALMLLMLTGMVMFMLISSKHILGKFFWATVFFLLLINIFAAGSRWGWIGICLLIGMGFFVFHFPHKILITCIASLMFICTFVAMSMIPSMVIVDKFERLFFKASKDIGFSERKAKIMMSIDMVREYPVLGVGTGISGKLTPQYLRRGSRVSVRALESSISGYATLVGDNGLLGFFAYNIMLFMVFLEIFKSRLNDNDTVWKNLGASILISLTGFVFCMIAYPSLGCRYAWIIYGLGAVYGILSRSPDDELRKITGGSATNRVISNAL